MSLSAPLSYCCADGSTKPLTLAQAMAAEKCRGDEVSIVNNTPPAADFLGNSNNSNHINHNHLFALAAVAAIVSNCGLQHEEEGDEKGW